MTGGGSIEDLDRGWVGFWPEPGGVLTGYHRGVSMYACYL